MPGQSMAANDCAVRRNPPIVGAARYGPGTDANPNPDLPAVSQQVSGRSAAVVLYSWQPGVLRQLIPDTHVQHEAVPESLARHFRLGT